MEGLPSTYATADTHPSMESLASTYATAEDVPPAYEAELEGSQQESFSSGTVLSIETFAGHAFEVEIATESPVGVGATAHVLKAKSLNTTTRDEFALKKFASPLTAVDRKIMAREIAAVQGIRHDHILPFIGTCKHGVHTMLVSHFMINGNLASYLECHADADRLRLVTQVAEAVAFLHNGPRMVHGDLKCQNVLVSDSGDALLADFGLSTAIDKLGAETTTMTAIRRLHTLRFSAPEILLQDGEVTDASGRERSKTPATDVYAYGMLVLQAFSGLVPWHESDNRVVFSKVLRGMIPISNLEEATRARLTPELWRICRDCWKFDPKERVTIVDALQQMQQLQPRITLESQTDASTVIVEQPACNDGESDSSEGQKHRRHLAHESLKGAMLMHLRDILGGAGSSRLGVARSISDVIRRRTNPASVLTGYDQIPERREIGGILLSAMKDARKDEQLSMVRAFEREAEAARVAWQAKAMRVNEELAAARALRNEHIAQLEEHVVATEKDHEVAVDSAVNKLSHAYEDRNSRVGDARRALHRARDHWRTELDRARKAVDKAAQSLHGKFTSADRDHVYAAHDRVYSGLQTRIDDLEEQIDRSEAAPPNDRGAQSALFRHHLKRMGLIAAKGIAGGALLGATEGIRAADVAARRNALDAAQRALKQVQASSDAAIAVVASALWDTDTETLEAVAAAQGSLQVAEVLRREARTAAEAAVREFKSIGRGPVQTAEAAVNSLRECDELFTFKVAEIALEIARAAESWSPPSTSLLM